MYTIWMMTFSKWLEDQYLDWQKKNGRKAQKYFAQFLGVKPATLSEWMNDKYLPSDYKNVWLLAEKLGDDVYQFFPDIPQPEADESDRRADAAMREFGQWLFETRTDPDSLEGRNKAIEILDKWGFTATIEK